MKKTTDLFRVIWQKDGENIDITDVCEGLNWRESEDGHIMSCGFSVPDAEQRYLERYEIQTGDRVVIVFDGNDEFYFSVLGVSRNWPRRNISAKDFCYYIEQNEIIIQFSGVSAKKACEDVCAKLGIECVCCEMSAEINGVFIDSAESVLEQILEKQKLFDGQDYDFEMRGKVLYIYRLTKDVGVYRYKPAENVAEFDVTQEHTRCEYSEDAESLKNSITAVVRSRTDGNLPAVEYSIEDSESISRYGKLNKKIEVSSENVYKIDELAKNELIDKNKPKRSVYCEMYGSINARVNRVMHIVDEWTGTDCLMRITECEHELNGGVYKMRLGLKEIDEYESGNYKESIIEREEIDINGTGVTYYDGDDSTAAFDIIEAEAEKYLGVPYVWGGYSPKGFDCSGFVCYVLNKCGYNIGRTTAQGLYDMTKRVKSPQPGDLVFWINTNPNSPNLITHVGLCIGNGKNIQASSSKGVCVAGNGGAYAYGRFA